MAARLFREKGFDGVGLDAIMKEAGLTHGGFYGHFSSKEDLAAEAVARALEQSAGWQSRHTNVTDFVRLSVRKPFCRSREWLCASRVG